MDCIVHGVAKSRARLSDFHFTTSCHTDQGCGLRDGEQDDCPVANTMAATSLTDILIGARYRMTHFHFPALAELILPLAL